MECGLVYRRKLAALSLHSVKSDNYSQIILTSPERPRQTQAKLQLTEVVLTQYLPSASHPQWSSPVLRITFPRRKVKKIAGKSERKCVERVGFS